jgi:beta-1,3-galactosyltransferase 1
MFFITVAAFMVVRNMFVMLSTETVSYTDDADPSRSQAAQLSSAHDVETMVRQFSNLPSTRLHARNITRKNDTIVYQEKSDKNHTLLKANMSHVGEIVKKIHDVIPSDVNVAKPHPFKYVINSPNICGKDQVFIMVYIHTAPDHYKRRMVIRRTWGKTEQYSVPLRVVFVMGLAKLGKNSSDSEAEQALLFESEQYGDIVQEDFLDSYHNLTHKGVAALKWITNYCSQATYILKTDDDIFVNMYTLIRHMQHLHKNPNNTHSLLMCAVWYGMPVMRTGKWKVTKEEWKDDYYPTYCSGSAFVLSTDVAIKLYKTSYHVPFFWVDDFYITGLLPLKAGNITHRQFLSTFVLNGDKLEELFTGPQWYSYIFSHVHNLNRIQAVWDTMTRMMKGEIPIVIKTALPGQLKKQQHVNPDDY